MGKKVYNLVENVKEVDSCQIKRGHRVRVDFGDVYYQGITLDADWLEPYTIATFEKEEDALEALKGYQSTWRDYSSNGCYHVTEYYVEEVCVDEEGELLWGANYCAFAPMKN